MALASWRVQVISRGKGKSSIAAVAYRSGEKIKNGLDGVIYNYTRRKDVIYTEILAPENAPGWIKYRDKLWNINELTELRKDARLAREIRFALPKELDKQQNIEIARNFASMFVKQGMVADLSVHDKGDGNPHAHIMLTTRTIDGNGFGKKNRDWDKKELFLEWQKSYEQETNKVLEKYGYEERIDIRSYKEQGIDKTPRTHLSRIDWEKEQRGIKTKQGDINREIEKENQELEAIKKELEELEYRRQIEKYKQGRAIHRETVPSRSYRVPHREIGEKRKEREYRQEIERLKAKHQGKEKIEGGTPPSPPVQYHHELSNYERVRRKYEQEPEEMEHERQQRQIHRGKGHKHEY